MLLIMCFFFFPFYPFIQDASEIKTLMEKEEVSTIVLTSRGLTLLLKLESAHL